MLKIELRKQDKTEEITSYALVCCPRIFLLFLKAKADKDCVRAWALVNH